MPRGFQGFVFDAPNRMAVVQCKNEEECGQIGTLYRDRFFHHSSSRSRRGITVTPDLVCPSCGLRQRIRQGELLSKGRMMIPLSTGILTGNHQEVRAFEYPQENEKELLHEAEQRDVSRLSLRDLNGDDSPSHEDEPAPPVQEDEFPDEDEPVDHDVTIEDVKGEDRRSELWNMVKEVDPGHNLELTYHDCSAEDFKDALIEHLSQEQAPEAEA